MHDALINDLGGTKAVADKLGVALNVVSNWRKRGIPWHWRPQVAQLAVRTGVVPPPEFLSRDSAA